MQENDVHQLNLSLSNAEENDHHRKPVKSIMAPRENAGLKATTSDPGAAKTEVSSYNIGIPYSDEEDIPENKIGRNSAGPDTTNDEDRSLHDSNSPTTTNSENQDKGRESHQIDRKKEIPPPPPPLGKLNCAKHGGPQSEEATKEMIYWRDIPSDRQYQNPYYADRDTNRKFLSVEVDEGGFNNVRMTVEIAMAMAFATGRTFVLPPMQGMYLMPNAYSLHDFFDLDGLDVVEMRDFLEQQVMTGRIVSRQTGQPTFPPGNRTDWTVKKQKGARELDYFMRTISISPKFRPLEQVIFIPPGPVQDGVQGLQQWKLYGQELRKQSDFGKRFQEYLGHPTPVDARPRDRFREQFADRDDVWLYHAQRHHDEPLIHFMAEDVQIIRMHGHFYHALFFLDWKMEMVVKRYVRDRLRYRDELFCAAGRIVEELRKRALRHESASSGKDNSNNVGTFYSYHVRRNDFAWKPLVRSSSQIVNATYELVPEGATVYVATDEEDKSWFDAMKEHYHVYFLSDFMHLIQDMNSNYHGIIDQIIVSRGKVFIGAYYSTVTSHANRLRGYYTQVERKPGWEEGILDSYHYAPLEKKDFYRIYQPMAVQPEDSVCPIAWRFIDKGID